MEETTINGQLEDLIRRVTKRGQLDRQQLLAGVQIILERYRTDVDNALRQLHPLIRAESSLTIPLSDGCVARVNFSGEVNQENMAAFAIIFQSIAENYFVKKAQSAQAQ